MNDRYRDLDEAWFAVNGTTDPAAAAALWKKWAREGRAHKACLGKALELATGLSASAIRHYLNNRTYKLSAATLARMDAICRALKIKPPVREARAEEFIRASLMDRKLALLTPMEGVPSLSYYMEVIRSVTNAATLKNFQATLHEVSLESVSSSIQGIVRHYRPSAMILVRLTPDAQAVQTLAKHAIPTVLIHADRLKYPSLPILGNIVPDQKPMLAFLRSWIAGNIALQSNEEICNELDLERVNLEASTLPHPGLSPSRQVVIVAMPDEPDRLDFDPIEAEPPSLRTQRKKLMLEALKEFNPEIYEVEDYSFRHALNVVRAHPNAMLYLCLSDEIAVGVKHHLEAKGLPTRNRIIGFDDSSLALKERITSFGQSIPEIGSKALELLSEWFNLMKTSETAAWPEFEETAQEMSLSLRD